jgi:hypothetical protein
LTDWLRDPFRAAEAIGLAKAVDAGRIAAELADQSGIDWHGANRRFLGQRVTAAPRDWRDTPFIDDSEGGSESRRPASRVSPVVFIPLPDPRGFKVEAFPGPSATQGGRVEHLPDHIHVREPGRPDVKISTDTWRPIKGSPAPSRAVQKWLNDMSEESKQYIRGSQRDIYNTGRISGRSNLSGAKAAIVGPTKPGANPAFRDQEARTAPPARIILRNARGSGQD